MDYVQSDTRNRPRPIHQQAKCTRCGRGPHTQQNCPAKGAICRRCGKKWNFGAMCFSKSIAMVSQEEPEPAETSYLDAIMNPANKNEAKSWNVQLQVNGKDVCFKIDTGAEVSAISKDVFEAIGRPSLQKPTKILCGPDKTPLDVLGCATVQLSYKQLSIKHHMYVIQRLSNNLLGLPAITALNILVKWMPFTVEITSYSQNFQIYSKD